MLLALEISREAARTPSKRTVNVARQAVSDWTSRPPSLTLPDAAMLLGMPFGLMFENWRSDYKFLLAAANPQQRAEITQWKQLGWAELHNGGGLSDMQNRVEEIKKEEPARRLALWLLFDSDARTAGKPSRQSRDLFGACGRLIPRHQLTRRSIENYVPERALRAWAAKKGDTTLKHRVDAFYSMSDAEQRHHFPMKGGLESDRGSADGENQDLYGPERLRPALRARLERGFGDKLRDVFADEGIGIQTHDLRRDGSFDELNSAIGELLGWMK
ncbi:MAG: hypothetical protein R3B70_02405 [Polyangiaceae bacterium]